MKRDRELTGIFIRTDERGKWESRDIGDCEPETVEKWIDSRIDSYSPTGDDDPLRFLKILSLGLLSTIRKIGEQCDIGREELDEA